MKERSERIIKRTWNWFISSYYIGGKDHDTICRWCKSAGFSGIEGGIKLFDGLTDHELREIGALYRARGVDIPTFHLPYSTFASHDHSQEYDLTSFREEVRKVAVEHTRRWMERAALLGSAIAVLHPTGNWIAPVADNASDFQRTLDKSLKELLPVAETLGLTLALENLHSGVYGSRPEHVRYFAEVFRHPRLGFCLDTGHALMMGPDTLPALLTLMMPRLVAYHLHDNDGTTDAHWLPGKGKLNWSHVFTALKAASFRGAVCLETDIECSPNSWRQAVESMERLASAGVFARTGSDSPGA